MKIKQTLKYFCITVILLISFLSVVQADDSYKIEYTITTFGGETKDCSVEYTNLENNKKMKDYCEHCTCFQDLTNIDAKGGDLISAKICIRDDAFCNTDNFRIGGNKTIFQSLDFQPCIPNYNVFFKFTSFTREDINTKSKSQDLLYFKEDDLLRLDRIDIVKDNDCELNGWFINFKMLKPNGEENNPFGIRMISVPKLNKSQVYSLVFDKMYNKRFGDDITFKVSNYSSYIDYIPTGEVFIFRGTQELSIEKTWEFDAWLSRTWDSNFFIGENYKVNLRFIDGTNNREPYFKVMPKSEHELREDTKVMKEVTETMQNLTLALLALTIIMVIPAMGKIYEILKNTKAKINNKEINSLLIILWTILLFGGYILISLYNVQGIIYFSFIILVWLIIYVFYLESWIINHKDDIREIRLMRFVKNCIKKWR